MAEPSTTGHLRALRAQDGEVARRVAKAAFVLLERGVVFLVDDDHAEIGHRREHRRARAEHDARLARDALPPGGEALGVGERGMQHRDRHGETFAEARHELRREPDFRHQHQRAPAAAQRVLHRVQIDLGLAAAGDAIQQEGREASRAPHRWRPPRPPVIAQGRASAAHQVGCAGSGEATRRRSPPRKRSPAPPARAWACASPRSARRARRWTVPRASRRPPAIRAGAARASVTSSAADTRLGGEPAFGEGARGGDLRARVWAAPRPSPRRAGGGSTAPPTRAAP